MSKNIIPLTAERLRETLHYDPETGVFTRRASRQPRFAAYATGSTAKNGYVLVYVDSVRYYAHRLVWLYLYGAMPVEEIDHINGVRVDNRRCNLRPASRQANAQNQRKPRGATASGFLGVHKTGRTWCARIMANGKRIVLGHFASPEEAHTAYVAAKRRLHAPCTL